MIDSNHFPVLAAKAPPQLGHPVQLAVALRFRSSLNMLANDYSSHTQMHLILASRWRNAPSPETYLRQGAAQATGPLESTGRLST